MPSTADYGYVPPRALKGFEERIHDEAGIGRSHSVIHRKREYDMTSTRSMAGKPYKTSPFGVVTYTPTDISRYEAEYLNAHAVQDGAIGAWDLSPTFNPAPPTGWSFTNDPYDESTVINDLYEKANQLKADAILNMIEANQIWPSMKSLAGCLPQMARNWKSIRKVIRTASDSYLAWKFGVSPLVSDLTNIVKFAPDMNRQYEQFVRQKNIRFTRFIPFIAKFSKAAVNNSANGKVVERYTYQGYISGNPPGIRYVLVIKPKESKYLTEAFKKADYLMRRFSTSPASLAWEKIPFSFVFDWFVDMRGVLAGIDKALGQKPYTVLNLSRSESYDVTSEAFWDYYSPCSGDRIAGGRGSRRRFKHYERLILPNRDFMPHWKGRFGKNQAAISAALIAQSVTRLRAK